MVVRVKPPWYATRGLIASKFKDAVPDYEALAGLERKYFTIADDGRYGGVYFWRSRAEAEAHFTDAWRANLRERRGTSPDVVYLDAQATQSGPALISGAPVAARAVDYPAFITVTSGPPVMSAGVVRAWSVRLSDGAAGAVTLWASREVQRAVGGTPLWSFDAPVLLDDELRQASR